MRVKGFSATDHAFLERILPCLRTACEFRVLRRLELPLLDRFSGTRTAERMLASGLLGHKTESTDAALMLVKFETDVGDLEPALMEETIRKTASIVSGLGGFVLSIDDDSMLAMFPQEAKTACMAAVAAAEHITEKSKDEDPSSEASPSIVLHYGGLTYGQVATPFGLRLTMRGRDIHHLKKLGHVASHGITLSQHFSELAGMKRGVGLIRA
jgi:adenylate cyclase